MLVSVRQAAAVKAHQQHRLSDKEEPASDQACRTTHPLQGAALAHLAAALSAVGAMGAAAGVLSRPGARRAAGVQCDGPRSLDLAAVNNEPGSLAHQQ